MTKKSKILKLKGGDTVKLTDENMGQMIEVTFTPKNPNGVTLVLPDKK